MTNDKRIDHANRDRIMDLLSPAELATVSNAEDGAGLKTGEEYIDLGHLEQGVLIVPVAATSRMLPRRAVNAATWTEIIALLPAR